MKFLVLIVLIGYSSQAFARKLFNCTETFSAHLLIDKKSKDWKIKGGIDKPNNPTKIRVLFYPNEAILFWDFGPVKWSKIGPDSYLETTSRGNVLWTTFPKKNGSKLILVQQKSYDILNSPISISTAYECTGTK